MADDRPKCQRDPQCETIIACAIAPPIKHAGHEDLQVDRRSVEYRQASSSRACHNTYGRSKPTERAALTYDMPTDEQDGLSEQTDFLSVLRAPSDHENEAANQPRVIPLPSSMTDALADYFSLTTPQREDLHEHFDRGPMRDDRPKWLSVTRANGRNATVAGYSRASVIVQSIASRYSGLEASVYASWLASDTIIATGQNRSELGRMVNDLY
ncbi:hypothetical protein JB92DRAFT_2832582 [Gautieria morchelliformis]|nr:hypothetical protein JB92DRAFT_2832582 [Gautieria morchelliformis]